MERVTIIEIIQSCVYCLLITFLLGIVLITGNTSLDCFFYSLLVWLWPVGLLARFMLFKYTSKHIFAWSLAGWGVCSVILVIANLLTYDKVLWCVYPVVGIFMWPLSVLIKIKLKEKVRYIM